MENLDNQPLIRYGKPNEHDHAPKGTICHVLKAGNPDHYDLYVQISTDEQNPDWINIEYSLKNHY